MYRLAVNDIVDFEGLSLFDLFRRTEFFKPGDWVEIWKKDQTQWLLLDGGLWR